MPVDVDDERSSPVRFIHFLRARCLWIVYKRRFTMSTPATSPGPELTRERLPTLYEVLARRTSAPVDLFFFYIYMRDQQRSVDYLDFW